MRTFLEQNVPPPNLGGTPVKLQFQVALHIYQLPGVI